MSKNCCKTTNTKSSNILGVDYFLLSIILATLTILGVVIFLGTKLGSTPDVSASANTKIEVEETRHNWGDIDYDIGVISKTFTIKNTGNDTLKLYDIKTSCMCTTAQLKTDDSTSKKFGMHEKVPEVFEVPAGETVEVFVEFQPAFHGPSGLGPITRLITMNTNDESNPTVTFYLSGNVVQSQ